MLFLYPVKWLAAGSIATTLPLKRANFLEYDGSGKLRVARDGKTSTNRRPTNDGIYSLVMGAMLRADQADDRTACTGQVNLLGAARAAGARYGQRRSGRNKVLAGAAQVVVLPIL
jgi:hypothetical protein